MQPARDGQNERFLQALEVRLRVEQSVGVIDAQAGRAVAHDDVENQRVSGPEDLLAVAPQRRQGVDIEETAIVDLVVGDLPVGQPIGLCASSPSSASKLRALRQFRSARQGSRDCVGDHGMIGHKLPIRRLITSFSRCLSTTCWGPLSVCSGRFRSW